MRPHVLHKYKAVLPGPFLWRTPCKIYENVACGTEYDDVTREKRTAEVDGNLLMGGMYTPAWVKSGICVRVCSVGVEGKGDKSKPANFVVSRFLPHSTTLPSTCKTFTKRSALFSPSSVQLPL